ncbi:MAG: hypothetical protein SFW63_06455 [Alphaproteobacteria bacterium]|nr:hypothetical protein [Alphaproteobacteria bacterium]
MTVDFENFRLGKMKNVELDVHVFPGFADAANSQNDESCVWINARATELASDDLEEGAIARTFPERLAKAAKDFEIALQILDGVGLKLKAKGYAVKMANHEKPKLGIKGDGELELCLTIETGKSEEKTKTKGLEQAIKDAYAEVLRENKALAAYMSKGQGAGRGA